MKNSVLACLPPANESKPRLLQILVRFHTGWKDLSDWDNKATWLLRCVAKVAGHVNKCTGKHRGEMRSAVSFFSACVLDQRL